MQTNSDYVPIKTPLNIKSWRNWMDGKQDEHKNLVKDIEVQFTNGFDELSWDEVVNIAHDHYRGIVSYPVTKEILTVSSRRIVINYIRHNFTNYDIVMDSFLADAHSTLASMAWRRKVINAIRDRVPEEYRNECKRQNRRGYISVQRKMVSHGVLTPEDSAGKWGYE